MSHEEVAAPIPRRILRAVHRALRFKVLALMNEAFANSGMTEEALASRLGWSVARVRRVLRGTGGLTLRTIAEMFFAIDGSTVQFNMRPLSHTKDTDNG